MDIKQLPANFDDWMPIHVFEKNGLPYVDWCCLHGERFVQPFFDTTIQVALRSNFSQLFRYETPADDLIELSAARPGLAPTGFIFHMSRCGSTLAAQMLSALSQNIVISEASAIDAILRIQIPDAVDAGEKRAAWLRGMINAFGRKRFPDEARYFVKFDSWHTLNLNLIRSAFPGVPWIFLYRDPAEVIVSHMWQTGAQMIPGTIGHLLPGLGILESARMPREEYCALVLERICECVFEQINKNPGDVLLVNYSELPGAVTSAILDHFGLSYSAEDLDKMSSAAKFDAKNPQSEFVADGEKKRAQATEAVLRAAEKVAPLYEKLELARKRSPAAGQAG